MSAAQLVVVVITPVQSVIEDVQILRDYAGLVEVLTDVCVLREATVVGHSAQPVQVFGVVYIVWDYVVTVLTVVAELSVTHAAVLG